MVLWITLSLSSPVAEKSWQHTECEQSTSKTANQIRDIFIVNMKTIFIVKRERKAIFKKISVHKLSLAFRKVSVNINVSQASISNVQKPGLYHFIQISVFFSVFSADKGTQEEAIYRKMQKNDIWLICGWTYLQGTCDNNF